ncbi:HAD-IB family phosphatase [Heliobacterium gestii]|uniref:phosphoserine phosphatase n=1 Tax=Heliomicrobium gestii TaxID=2699 RepID=A0A845LLV4_HELGE|nr:HAD family phosphatase [Heliomicrobium gestii]MBM7867292.1 phosphoserine phosphatase [Heliomicrobium gestii]MZP43846.1 HAD-IB family phosphatase [Heliomicrobium gestii]
MLVFFDVDGTLTTGPNVWEVIYRRLGLWESMGIPIQEAFLNGAIDYREFAAQDAAHFAGAPVEAIEQWISEIPLRPDAAQALEGLQSHGCRIILLSTGLTALTDHLSKKFGAFASIANELEVVDGRLTGRVFVHVSADDIHRDKGAWVRRFCKKYRINAERTAAIGDSVGDIPMFRQVELPILFRSTDSLLDDEPIHQAVPGILQVTSLLEAAQAIIDFVQPSRYWLGWRSNAR